MQKASLNMLRDIFPRNESHSRQAFSNEGLVFGERQRTGRRFVAHIANSSSSTHIFQLLKEKSDVESSSMNSRPLRRHEFTLVHGFYASMGGFVFDLLDEDGEREKPAFLPAGRTRMTITSMGVRFLMEHYPDLIPDLSETSITDRSSASSLSKALLIVQLTWFCTNCVARLGQGLPLSLLEVTTVAHGLCTLVTYFLWWKKPLNIAEPTFIRGPEADKACALMTMCSPDVRHELFGTVSIHFPAEMHSITTLDRPDSEAQRGPSLSYQRSSLTLNSEETVPNTEESTLVELETFVILKPEQQALEGTNFTPLKEAAKTPYHDLKISVLYDSHSIPWYAKQRDPKGQEPVVIRPEDANRWRLAFSAMRQSGLDRKTIEPLLPEKPYVSSRSTLQSSSDFKGRGIKPIIRSNLSATALTLIYGVPHFLGWNARFPTILEQHLWRIATVMVAFWGASMGCVVALIVIVRLLMRDFTGERRGEAGLVAGAASVYILTAGYLLLESLRQLLYLEPAAYELPAWSNYWPHVS